MTRHNPDQQFGTGLAFALAAFGFWGLVQPYFFGAFETWGALVIVAHRTLWSCLFIWIWIAFRRDLSGALAMFRQPRMLAVMALTGFLIASNWGTYIYAVQAERLLDASIGYFMAPLMTAAFGMLFLGERPRVLQIWALIFAALGVLLYTLWLGIVPLVALYLSISFSAYGGIRKLVAAPAERGMAVETGLIAPFAVVVILLIGRAVPPYLIAFSASQAGLLILAGLVTLLPLVWYNAAAIRLPLISLGLLQFIVPVGLFTLSLLPPLSEELDMAKALMVAFIWAGLLFYVVDLVRSARSSAAPS